ncbi:peroxiredoxin [Paracoccaceae bacterium Fryx2]|nr:peroxiredoxin [Paracoccaceae bacterium Fryx2]
MTDAPLDAGHDAPDFTLPRDGGGTVTLSALRPGMVVLYFYPKDDTPGCTTEALDFTASAPAFAALGATVIGVSKDSIKAHDKFVKKHALGIALVSDEAGTVCEDYGTWVEKSMYGKTYMGIERSTVLIDGTGKVARVWRKVTVKGHVEEVLAAVSALSPA